MQLESFISVILVDMNIIFKDMLEEAHNRLLTMVKFIEKNYNSEKISRNLHFCLIMDHYIHFGAMVMRKCETSSQKN